MKIITTPSRFFSATTAAAMAHVVCCCALWLLPSSVVMVSARPTTTTSTTLALSSSSPLSRSALLADAVLHQRVLEATTAATTFPMRFPMGRAAGLGQQQQQQQQNMDFFYPLQGARRRRALQTTTTTTAGGNVCAPIDAFADDDDTLRQFDSDFNPTCNCDEEGTVFDEILVFFDENPFPEDATSILGWVDSFNEAGRSLESVDQVGCINKCSVCLSGGSPCLVLEELERSSISGGLNITPDEWVAFGESTEDTSTFFTDQLLVFSTEVTNTICYMAAGSLEGKVCYAFVSEFSSTVGVTLSWIVDGLTSSDLTNGCAVSVDDVDCTSCVVDSVSGCVTADCTNIGGDSSTTINTCNADRASFPGVYGPLYDIVRTNTVYTLGSCDGDSNSSPTAPSPLSTPTATAPVAIPVAEPASTPEAASSPVAMPLPVAVPAPVPVPVAVPAPVPVAVPGSSPAVPTNPSSPVVATNPSSSSSTTASPPIPPVVPAGLGSGATTAVAAYDNFGGVVVGALVAVVLPLVL